MQPYFLTLARYNQWANATLNTTLDTLDNDTYHLDRGAFFGSIHGTLNHVLAGERIWLQRLTEQRYGVRTLDQVIVTTYDEYKEVRVHQDQTIIDEIAKLDETHFTSTLSYAGLDGTSQSSPADLSWGHFFNHGTHHRGQVHTMLTQIPVAAPALDLIYYVRGHMNK